MPGELSRCRSIRPKTSRMESQPFSQQQAQGVQGASQSHQGPNIGGKKAAKESKTLHEATHIEGRPHQQRVAVCELWPNQLDDTQGVSPVPQNAPRSFQPSASQVGGIGIHGPSSCNLGGCRQGQIGPRVRKDCASDSRRSSSRSNRPCRTISRRLPLPRPSSKTQSALSSGSSFQRGLYRVETIHPSCSLAGQERLESEIEEIYDCESSLAHR